MKGGVHGRALARLAAVQALYQMEISGIGVEAVVREFGAHRFDSPNHEPPLIGADADYFARLLRGAVAEQAGIDGAITARLAEGWRLDRLDATVRAILRCAGFELLHCPDVPREVVIDQYLEVAKSFHGAVEAGFINGALDKMADDAGRP